MLHSGDICSVTGLNESETDHLNKFRIMHPGRQCVYTLSQNPEQRDMASGPEVLHTITASANMLWNDSLNRWATGRESLSFQGFPVYDCTLKAIFADKPVFPLSSFNITRSQRGIGSRLRSAMVHQTGNSMHCGVVCAVLLWVMAFTCKQQQDTVPRSLPLPPALTDAPAAASSDKHFDDAVRAFSHKRSRTASSFSSPGTPRASAAPRTPMSVASTEDGQSSESFDAMFQQLSNRKKRTKM